MEVEDGGRGRRDKGKERRGVGKGEERRGEGEEGGKRGERGGEGGRGRRGEEGGGKEDTDVCIIHYTIPVNRERYEV